MTTTITGTEHALALHRSINSTEAEFPNLALHMLFERAATAHAASTAVIDGRRTLTYAELDERANSLAARLIRVGVEPGSVVAVAVKRSVELVTALVAVIKCGATYLPVDAGWPDARIRLLLDETASRHLVTDAAEPLARRCPDRITVPVEVPNETGGQWKPTAEVAPDAWAYINYTSGSTGAPKGVPVPHRAVARLVFDARYADLSSRPRILQFAPVTFDAATFEIWGALLNGGVCVLYPASLLRLSVLKRTLADHDVDVVFLTTALFNTILDEDPAVLDPVRTVLTGGEAHSVKHMARALARYGPDKIVSVYGPTESTTFATFHPIRRTPDELSALPIGKPIQNTRLYLIRDQTLCEPGELGEVCLAGPGLSPGYLGAPELTARRFVDCRIGDRHERIYRTGDRAYLREDGEVVFQGRDDDQVKVRGFRIELGEVAQHLDRCPGVGQCFVTVTTEGGEKTLVAFVTASDGELSDAAVRDHLAHSLPGYMIPSRILVIDELPMGPTGKVDRRALLAALQEGAVLS
ncbi:amino acid adenylation domain-containing protein [Nocardia sp. CDC159]|uniref:Amino acid adenylation domain-containing protein n=1 Tax=Nocardia pulmonis TaxID=2951408 RepID=A0A9X2E6Y7_9NOCA|nr:MULTISPECIES: amino acid adenylation domain-containing protein [Nocardia]MCM6774303.1 amino acid adenylation domain-containing protein [Nocardia pulmonis]MCM6787631.1 amino acid adenylation domain-containing protein [Nocardia sp. CDC159]